MKQGIYIYIYIFGDSENMASMLIKADCPNRDTSKPGNGDGKKVVRHARKQQRVEEIVFDTQV